MFNSLLYGLLECYPREYATLFSKNIDPSMCFSKVLHQLKPAHKNSDRKISHKAVKSKHLCTAHKWSKSGICPQKDAFGAYLNAYYINLKCVWEIVFISG